MIEVDQHPYQLGHVSTVYFTDQTEFVTFGPWKSKLNFQVQKVIFIKNNRYHWILHLEIDINTCFYRNWVNLNFLVFWAQPAPGHARGRPGHARATWGWVGALKCTELKFSNWADTIPPRYTRFLSNLRYFPRGGCTPPLYEPCM